MHPTRIAGPLSPPSSPRMAGHDYKSEDSLWNNQAPSIPSIYSGYKQSPPDESPYTSSSYPGQPHESHIHYPPPGDSAIGIASVTPAASVNERTTSSRTDASSVTYPDRAPNKPSHHMLGMPTQSRPQSPGHHGVQSPDDASRSDGDEEEEDEDEGSPDQSSKGDKPPMTAAEIRNQKRKMKRFRLSHNQTRFLMSEFARQAHPDAAHRERLSREIPGLSPRQVQVWFQNRRAKLKRLTTEDRDRMMRSRALPDSFGIGLAMNNNAYAPSGEGGAPIAPEGGSAAGLRPGQLRPLTLDTFQRPGDRNYISPGGVGSALGSLAFTPPQSATDTHSPISTSGEMGAYGFSQRGLLGSPRGGGFPISNSAPIYQTQFPPSSGRIPNYDGLRRPSGGSISSPLRSSMSYGGFSTSLPSAQDPRAPGGPLHDRSGSQNQRDVSREMPPPSGPYGLGFSYDTMASFPQPHQQANAHASAPPSRTAQSPHASQPPYRSPAPSVSSQGGQFPPYMASYSGSTYASPQMPHYQPSYGGPYTSPLQSSGFSSHPNNAQIPVQGAHTFSHMGATEGSKAKQETEGDESDGGVAISASY